MKKGAKKKRGSKSGEFPWSSFQNQRVFGDFSG